MAYNDRTIESIRKWFEPPFTETDKRYNSDHPFTNCVLVFAYNGTGKTRLSYDFAHYGRKEDSKQHTLYYNAYTEDLFTWKNDFEDNTENRLIINQDALFVQGLAGYKFEDKLRKYLQIFTDIDFDIQYDGKYPDVPGSVVFSKKIYHKVMLNGEWTEIEDEVENIKISRGEERIFVWCFFRCIMDQVLGGNTSYKDIEYIYIDDPMSSLDDNNVIAFAQQLYLVIRQQHEQEVEDMKNGKEFRRFKFVVSSHHALFFHVMLHGLNGDQRLGRFYLSRNKQKDELVLKDMSDTTTPFYYNVAMMSELDKAIRKGPLYTYHFTVLRSVMEKIKEFFGHKDFSSILDGIEYRGIKYVKDSENEDIADLYSRVVNVLTHQGAMFMPTEMNEDNRVLAETIFEHIKNKYQFEIPNLDSTWSEKKIAKKSQERQ